MLSDNGTVTVSVQNKANTWLSLGFRLGFGSSDLKVNVKLQWELGRAMDGETLME